MIGFQWKFPFATEAGISISLEECSTLLLGKALAFCCEFPNPTHIAPKLPYIVVVNFV